MLDLVTHSAELGSGAEVVGWQCSRNKGSMCKVPVREQ